MKGRCAPNPQRLRFCEPKTLVTKKRGRHPCKLKRGSRTQFARSKLIKTFIENGIAGAPCVVNFGSSHRAQIAKKQSAEKVGFTPIPERVPKVCKEHFLRKKCAKTHTHTHTLFSTLSGIGGNPTFSADFFFAIWALWLEPKFANLVNRIHELKTL